VCGSKFAICCEECCLSAVAVEQLALRDTEELWATALSYNPPTEPMEARGSLRGH
jgi:hypothetical protein